MSAAAAVESVIQAHLGNTFPACAVCVIHEGEVVVDGGWGWLDPETRQLPAAHATLFDLASLTKLFTTSAFLSFISQQGIGLDAPLVNVLPEFGALTPRQSESGQSVDPAQITFRHLLTHTSGLPAWQNVYQAAGAVPIPPDQPDTISRQVRWQQALATLFETPFAAPPDGVVRYSDVGLMLLGETVARLHGGGDLQVALQSIIDRIDASVLCFNPLRDHQIPRSQIAPTEYDAGWRGRRVWGEVHDENACGVGGVAGHAGLFGTARAVATFGAVWLDSQSPFGITPELRQTAITQQVESDGTRRGLGFALKAAVDSMAGDYMSMNAFGHSGFTGTSLWIDPDARLVIAALTNSVYDGRNSAAYGRTHAFRRALHDAIFEACRQ